MNAESSESIRLKKDQIKPASKVLARAFQDDPIFAYAYPDEAERTTKLPYIYEFLFRYNVRYAHVYTTSDKLEGIASWQCPEKIKMSFWRLLLSGAIWPAFKIGMQPAKRMQHFDEYIENKRRELVPCPHWYLAVLGVAPEFQGKGYASVLLRGMLSRIDKKGLPCYLETEKGKNVSLYQHFDFKVIEEYVVPETTVKLWAMLREGRALES